MNGRVYVLLSPSGWRDAEAKALELGGHLATIRSQQEQDWVFQTFGSFGGVNRNLWIGLHDPNPSVNAATPSSRRSEFVWSSGEFSFYQNWLTGEPNNSPPGESYVHLWLPGFGVSGFWNDHADNPPDNQPSFPWNGVVEVRRPEISCPGTIRICPSDSQDPDFTGRPAILFSCSPPDQIQFVHEDQTGFDGTITRFWTAIDPLCGTSETCTQTIRFFTRDDPTVVSTSELGGLVMTHRAVGTRGFIVDARWFIDAGGDFFELTERAGVHFPDPGKSSVVIDFTVFNRIAANSNYGVSVNVATSCTAQGGGFGSGTAPPPPYSLSRGVPRSDSSTGSRPVNENTAQDFVVDCGSYRGSSRAFLFRALDAGAASVTASLSSARLTVLDKPGQTTALACGAPGVQFPVGANLPYVIIVEATGEFTLSSQIMEPVRGIAVGGNLQFGTVEVGTSKTASMAIANIGNVPLNVSSITFPPGFSGNWPGGAVAAGATREVNVIFAPAQPVAYAGFVTVNSDAPSGNKILAASGTGTPSRTRIISLNGDLAFGEVAAGQSKQRSLNIANTGNSPLTITGISYPAGFSGNFNAGVIDPGGSRTVTITYSPQGVSSFLGNLVVQSDATGGSNSISVSGTGVTPSRVLQLSGFLSFDDVTVGRSEQRVLTLSNQGNAPLTVGTLNFPEGFTGDWPGGVLDPGETQTVVVRFTPIRTGAYGGLIMVASDATSGASTLAISGSGTLNSPPTISAIDDLTTPENTAITNVPFMIDDAETALGFLSLSAVSSDVSVVPAGGVSIGGSRSNRTVSITPAPNRSGTSVITITVTDLGEPPLSASASFRVTVGSTVRPSLVAVRGAAGSLTLHWDAAGAGFTLETRTSLGPGGGWSPVGGVPNPINSAGSLSVAPAGAAGFFRLRK